MRIFSIAFLSLFVGISGCTTFNSIEVVEPSVGMVPTEVSSLQPVLSWEKLESYDGSYDLIIMAFDQSKSWFKRTSMNVVYWKNDIHSTEHKVEAPLKSDYHYYWSVRPSTSKEDDDWARFNYYFIAGVVNFWMTDSYFRFKTPAFSPIVTN